MPGGGQRPVRDRAETEQQRAASRKEPLRQLGTPRGAHRLEGVEEEEMALPPEAAFPDRLQEGARLGEVGALAGVDHLELG